MNDNDESSKTIRISIPIAGGHVVKPARTVDSGSKIILRPPTEINAAPGHSAFDELFQSVYDAAVLCTLSGQIVNCNARAQDFFQYPKPAFCSMSIVSVVHGMEPALIRNICENLTVKRFTLIEAHCRRADGTYFPSEIAVNRLHLPSEQRLCFFIRDITLRRQAELEIKEKNRQVQEYATRMEALAEERAKQLVHADRMVRLGVMSAGIAHEVNNPATFISSNVGVLTQFWTVLEPLLRRSLDEAGETQRMRMEFILDEFPKVLAGIGSGVERITHIVKSLKTFSHQGKIDKEPTDINLCVQQSLEVFHAANKKFVTIRQDLAEGLPRIVADSRQLVQVLVNLLSNAADAMEPKGQGDIAISTCRRDDRIVIAVADTGPGIPPDKLNTIWDPFFTTKPVGKGTGLGLSISFNIIKAHGGSITAGNRAEGGAQFVIDLPVPTENETEPDVNA